MSITKTTPASLCRAFTLAFCFFLLPALVCAQNNKDKPKDPPAKPAAPPPAAKRPAQQPPSRPVQQAPAQQLPARAVQQAPVQQPPVRSVQQVPVQQQPAVRSGQQAPVQQPPVRPAQPPPFNNAERQPRPNNGGPGGGIIGGNRPNNEPVGGITGGNRPNNAPVGGITGGNRPNNEPVGGVTGGNRPNNTPGGGITGGNRPNNAPGGGITGGNRPNNEPVGGITGGNRPNNAPGGGITGGNRPNNAPGGGISGANRPSGPIYRPPSTVQTTRHPDGTQTHVDTRTRTTVHTDAGGRITTVERPGIKATSFREDGRAAHIEHTREDRSRLVVDRGLRGERRVEVVRPDGVRVVAAGRQTFVERPFRPGYVSRTYVTGGRTEVRVYRSYTYNTVHYVTYVPTVYYQPAFYGWAARPWGPRVVYAWGWEPAAPWFYGGYFAPAPVYDSPALWVTDFLLAANLRAAYDNQQQQHQEQQLQPPAPPVQNTGVMLTTEVKMQIAEEVKQQIAIMGAEQAANSQPTAAPASVAPQGDIEPPALKQRVFVVATNLDVTSIDDGKACTLTAGDVIERTPRQPITSDGKVTIDVMNSKPGDCQAEFTTQLDLATLQEMQNQFREQIAAGMDSLASNQGKSLPGSPSARTVQAVNGRAPEDNDAKRLIAEVNQQADQTEAEIRQGTNSGQ